MKIKVRKIAKGYGILLPKKVIDRLKLGEGSVLPIVQTATGISVSPIAPAHIDELEAFRRTEARHRQSYRELARSKHAPKRQPARPSARTEL